MSTKRTLHHMAIGALIAMALTIPLLAQISPGRQGIIVSEIHSQAYPDALPDYIELLNLDPTQAADLGGATISIITAGPVISSFTFPPGTSIPMFTPTIVGPTGVITPGTGTLTLVPIGATLPNTVEATLPVSQLFANPQALAPGVPTTICLDGATITGQGRRTDRVDLAGGVQPCGANSPPFLGQLPNVAGLLLRGYRVDSDTAADYIDLPPPSAVLPPDPPYTGPNPRSSPTVVNPEMSRVTGFYFGSTQAGLGQTGIPFNSQPNPVVSPGGTIGVVTGTGSIVNAESGGIQVTNLQNAVAWVEFGLHPYAASRSVRSAQFDPIIANGQLSVDATFLGRDPFLGHEPLTTFPQPTPVSTGMTWDLVNPTGAVPGVLNINMGPLDQADLGVAVFTPAAAADPRERLIQVERVLTDNLTNATASGSGDLTKVQIDILPPEGDIWCELIIYDGNGFSYRAKVRNWPPNPYNCSTPTLGLGSNAVGNIDIIATCFDPMAELFVLPTFNLAAPTGSGPFFGINPDLLSLSWLMSAPNTPPARSVTTVDGLFFYSLTAPSLSGLNVDAVAIQWGVTGPGGSGFTQFSNAATILVQ